MSRPSQISGIRALLGHRTIVATLVSVLVAAGLFLLGLAGQEALHSSRPSDVAAAGPTGGSTGGTRLGHGVGPAVGRHSIPVSPGRQTPGPKVPGPSISSPSSGSSHSTQVGQAAGPDPVDIEIPQIGVRTKVIRLGLADDGTVQVPPFDHADQVGWYAQSPVPGVNGPSVLIGHIDSPRGPAVFYRLATLNNGDQVRIGRKDGTIAVFRITAVKTVAKNHFPTRSVYGNINYPGLRLITCGGAYDASAGGYQANTIVYGSLVKIIPGHR